MYCIYRLTALLVESERLHTKPLVNYARDHPSLISDLSIFQHPCDAPFFGHLTTRAENVSGVLSSPYPTYHFPTTTIAAAPHNTAPATTAETSNNGGAAHINSTTSTAPPLPPLPVPPAATLLQPQPPSYGELYQYTDTEYDNEFACIHDPEGPDTDLITYLKTMSDQKLSLQYVKEKIEYERTSHLSQLKRKALIKSGIIKKRGPQVLETSVTNKNLSKMDIISRLNCEIVSDESVDMSILNDLFDHSAVVAVGVILEEVAREMMGAWRGAAHRQCRAKRPKRVTKSSGTEPAVAGDKDVTMDTEVDREEEESGDGEEESESSSEDEVGADDKEENEAESGHSSDDEKSGSDSDSSVGGDELPIDDNSKLNDTSPIKPDVEKIPHSISSSSSPSIKNSPTSGKNAELITTSTSSSSSSASSKLSSTIPPATKPSLKPVIQTGPLPYPNSDKDLKAECALQLQCCYWESVSAEGLTHILEVSFNSTIRVIYTFMLYGYIL